MRTYADPEEAPEPVDEGEKAEEKKADDNKKELNEKDAKIQAAAADLAKEKAAEKGKTPKELKAKAKAEAAKAAEVQDGEEAKLKKEEDEARAIDNAKKRIAKEQKAAEAEAAEKARYVHADGDHWTANMPQHVVDRAPPFDADGPLQYHNVGVRSQHMQRNANDDSDSDSDSDSDWDAKDHRHGGCSDWETNSSYRSSDNSHWLSINKHNI